MESDMEKQGRKRRREEEEEDFSDACNLAVDAEAERCPKKARKEPEGNIPAKQEDLISQLPDLIKDKVFGFLGVRDKVEAAQVSSSWQDAVYKPCQWREVKMTLDLSKLSEKDLSNLQRRKIRHLFVETFHEEPNTWDNLRDVLVSLDLSSKALPLSVLQKVFCKSFSSLRELWVSVDKTEPLVFQKLQKVFQHVSNLQIFDLEVDECNNDVVEAVARYLKRLNYLSLSASSLAECSLEFLGHLNSLQSLSVNNVELSGIDCLKSSCKTLEKITFRCCSFDTARWPEIVSQMSPLEELTLDFCTPEVEDVLRQVTEGQRNLRVLDYQNSSNDYDSIDLRCLTRMPNLEEFSVGGCEFESDDDFEALSCDLQKLRSLALCDCGNLTPAFMKGIAGLPSLQELSLTDLFEYDGISMEMISKGSCQLMNLTLRNCCNVRGEAMKHVAGMSSLRELVLVDMELGSPEVNYLKEGTLRLENLHIEDCGWTFQDVKPWLETQQSLQDLTLVGLGMTEAEKVEAQDLKKVLPLLRNVDTLN